MSKNEIKKQYKQGKVHCEREDLKQIIFRVVHGKVDYLRIMEN